ncbi:MAG: ferredoxin [Paracoccaceae bacterium]
MGAFHPGAGDGAPEGCRTLVLLGPAEPGFWAVFTQSSEWRDGNADPVDRWSARVLGELAAALGGGALLPFGGPPYHPFYRWALASGRAWPSPVTLLVHEAAGLMVSYRGALALPWRVELPPSPPIPCARCVEKPCLAACPAGALTGKGYDVPACHAYLDTTAGQTCMNAGCAVRRACPVSQSYARVAEQSAYHMRQFHR